MNDILKDKLGLLPINPGCYLMKNASGEIIYIGKAKKLKNRVKSYFTGSHNTKTALLVSEIVDFDYIITVSELEALILELNLIKQHDPKYNILLTDDKHYPYIKLTNERHPRLLTTRKIKQDRAKYFGPFPNSTAANETVRLLNQIYPLRKCHTLQGKVCLYYHISQCLAPCEYVVKPEQYEALTNSIITFLKGDYRDVLKELQVKMELASEKLDFERAKDYRDLISHVEATVQKQQVASTDLVDRDIFGFSVLDDLVCVQVFFVRAGKIISRDVSIFNLVSDTHEEVISFIARFYESGNLKPKEIFIPAELDGELLAQFLSVKVMTPKIGNKKKLVDLAMKNAEVALHDKQKLLIQKEERTRGAVNVLGEMLGIDPPSRIEAYDNSHHQGQDGVSAMVVFRDGQPHKKEYRKYKIKIAEAGDDYAMMKEVIYRRYFKVINENLPRADLIVIDGGIGQVRVVQETLDSLSLDIPVIGLVKDTKHKTRAILDGRSYEEIEFAGANRLVFNLLARVQEEVHRFVVTFHRQTHSKRNLTSVLDDIPGIGAKRKKELLKHMKSTDKMINATDEDYLKIGISSNLATTIREFLNAKKQS